MSWENDNPLECPFCGAQGKVTFLELREENGGFRIYCSFCGAYGPVSKKIDGACKKWNRRTK